MGEYLLRCVSDGATQPDHLLGCPDHGSLLRADYRAVRIEERKMPGIWRFLDWLPVKGTIEAATGGPVAYRSLGLSRELSLKRLYISFNGFWPEIGAALPTCSFKDLEAAPTMQRLMEESKRSQQKLGQSGKGLSESRPSKGRPSENGQSGGGQSESGQNESERDRAPTLVVASAGNTARAFAHIALLTGRRLLLFVPESALSRMWTTLSEEFSRDRVTLISVRGDYYDAIQIAEKVQSRPGFVPEGGARNIARRDGMGTVMVDAALRIGELPAHYFQAVGSGTGGISAWEASLRLIRDGRFGSVLPRLHLAQNIPNSPIYYAWKGIEPQPQAAEMFDSVLFNRNPPYAVPGGVRDALVETKGEVYGVTDREAQQAKKLFEESEQIDIFNAAAVAVAALQKAVESGAVASDDCILLNITGGGLERIKETHQFHGMRAKTTVSRWQDAVDFLESGNL